LTQLLSKSAQKMITELRRKVQAHIGRLPISFYDANKTGVLVSRIMSDVEGVRNLIGTGLVEFVGGLMTAVIALVYLIHTSVLMTAVAFSILLVFGFGISKAFTTIRPIFRARPKITGEVTGRLTSRWEECASSRATTRRSGKKKSLRPACSDCWTTC